MDLLVNLLAVIVVVVLTVTITLLGFNLRPWLETRMINRRRLVIWEVGWNIGITHWRDYNRGARRHWARVSQRSENHRFPSDGPVLVLSREQFEDARMFGDFDQYFTERSEFEVPYQRPLTGIVSRDIAKFLNPPRKLWLHCSVDHCSKWAIRRTCAICMHRFCKMHSREVSVGSGWVCHRDA